MEMVAEGSKPVSALSPDSLGRLRAGAGEVLTYLFVK